jgi:hypothetical protein
MGRPCPPPSGRALGTRLGSANSFAAHGSLYLSHSGNYDAANRRTFFNSLLARSRENPHGNLIVRPGSRELVRWEYPSGGFSAQCCSVR